MLFGRDRRTIKELRRELGEAREELWQKDNAIVELKWWLARDRGLDMRWVVPRKVAHRAPSDVLFIPHSEDLLR
jgi:hypothetical protein